MAPSTPLHLRLRLRRMSRSLPPMVAVASLFLAALAAPVDAQLRGSGADYMLAPPALSLTVRGGLLDYRAQGQVFDFTTREFEVERSDFQGGTLGMELGLRGSEHLDILLGLDGGQITVNHASRDFEELDGSPIRQSTRLRFGPAIQLGLGLYPLGRGETLGTLAWVPRTVAPFVSGGIGVAAWEFRQFGDFVDEDPPGGGGPVIFADDFADDGAAFLTWAGAGAEVSLRHNLALVLEGRYQWAESSFDGDFGLFDPIDLAGHRITLGLLARF